MAKKKKEQTIYILKLDGFYKKVANRYVKVPAEEINKAMAYLGMTINGCVGLQADAFIKSDFDKKAIEEREKQLAIQAEWDRTNQNLTMADSPKDLISLTEYANIELHNQIKINAKTKAIVKILEQRLFGKNINLPERDIEDKPQGLEHYFETIQSISCDTDSILEQLCNRLENCI